jgi:hypothetical protein|tara:strand:+ start:8378 stop:10000 length:1623 start_codon:yes stop_codon:yes gene_type:complete
MASEINVDKITPQTGTTLELGDNGDTITVTGTLDGSGLTGLNATNLTSGTVPDARFPATLPAVSGANLTGIETGTAWQSSLKTSSFTAVAGQGYFVNTTGGAITMTLPAGSVGATIEVVDVAGTFQTNNLTVAANGSEKIRGSTNNKILDGQNDGLRLVYSGATNGWVVPTSNEVVSIPSLTSITGNIIESTASDLTLAGINFLATNLVVNFFQSSDSIDVDVTVTPTSDVAATVSVPSSVYNNVTSGNAVTIKVTNSDILESNTVNKTAISLPTGGTITTSGNFKIHTFTSSGTLVNAINGLTIQSLVIAGGGGGGRDDFSGDRGAGGGGAGGYRNSTPSESSGGGASAEVTQNLSVASYTVTVGAGGGSKSAGSNSSLSGSGISTITSNGGGQGGSHNATGGENPGTGGSGGGALNDGSGAAGTSGQGFAGGSGSHVPFNGGGGGGAGSTGANGSNSAPGSGGQGLSSSITGSAVTRAGGGGARGGSGNASGGSGGGGAGGGVSGTANTGSGGGANRQAAAGSGGSGIVIIRYDITTI